MIHNDPCINYKRLLKDTEIVEAIKNRHIVLDDPDHYLRDRRDDLIQPASMDLVLTHIDPWTRNQIVEFVPPESIRDRIHENPHDGHVTFWPGCDSETYIGHLKGHKKELIANVELRSTLRRAGLDVGFNPFGVGFGEDWNAFIYVRNPQHYPVSVEKGEKIAQICWYDSGILPEQNGLGIIENPNKLGSGRIITSEYDLQQLIDHGDLFLSERNSIGTYGQVLFHAGGMKSYCRQGEVIIGKDGTTGFELISKNEDVHKICPGFFSDIETIERIGLTDKVAMQVFHYPNQPYDYERRAEMLNRVNTNFSTAGWIDPGYGHGKIDGAPFSFQRKTFTESIEIVWGDLIGFGIVIYFPDGVENAYGTKRGSHYAEEVGFVGPKL